MPPQDVIELQMKVVQEAFLAKGLLDSLLQGNDSCLHLSLIHQTVMPAKAGTRSPCCNRTVSKLTRQIMGSKDYPSVCGHDAC